MVWTAYTTAFIATTSRSDSIELQSAIDVGAIRVHVVEPAYSNVNIVPILKRLVGPYHVYHTSVLFACITPVLIHSIYQTTLFTSTILTGQHVRYHSRPECCFADAK
jgi:hypothetical protein